MNPERLLQNFDRLIDIPDAVPRLRRFILDLAMRGKLVEQNPEDEAAGDLLKRIEKKKAQLVKVGELKDQKSQLLNEEEIPFAIPANWGWTQLAQIGVINPRNNAEDATAASFIPMSLIFAEYGRVHQHEVRQWGEIKKGFTHFAEGDVGLAKITPCFENGKSTVFRNLTGGLGAGTTELHIVRPVIVLPDYILLYLKTLYFIDTGIPKMTGTAGQKRVSKDYFSFSPFPLPPLAEQHRIVAKVDELMKLCDELETGQAKRERRRDRLVAATLHGLNNGKTDGENGESFSFEDSASFYFNHLPRLTARPEHIQQLRQNILNLAVRGKLVPQDPKDEPAAELLKRIESEKERLIKKGAIKVSKSLSLIEDAAIPFDLPAGWKWTRLGDSVKNHFGGGTPSKSNSSYWDGDIFWASVKDIGKTKYVDKTIDMITKLGLENSSSNLIPPGNLIVVTRMGLGKLSINRVPMAINQDLRALILSSFASIDFYYIFFKTTSYEGSGMTVKGIKVEELLNFPFPLPPLAEQHRIVAKVDELMSLFDEMEARITTNTTTSRKLLEATLQEAL